MITFNVDHSQLIPKSRHINAPSRGSHGDFVLSVKKAILVALLKNYPFKTDVKV